MNDPLIILCPPRSFSSVVSTIIGEHPQLYGFPELHLFGGDTVDQIIKREAKAGNPAPAGLLRTLAQEHDGIQSTKTILKASIWLNERRHWSTKKLMDYLLELISPRIGVEKSPNTSRNKRFLERAYAMFPKAYYLHLTRHPVSSRKSIQEFWEQKKQKKKRKMTSLKTGLDGLFLWYYMHDNILKFTQSLPTGQTIRVKGEDILSEPEVYLHQLAQWLGLRTDAEAIEAMMHPENSPYAYVGPSPARGGNDPKFMRNPKMRRGKVKEPSLKSFLEHQDLKWVSEEIKEILPESAFELISEKNFAEEITKMANLMGYY